LALKINLVYICL